MVRSLQEDSARWQREKDRNFKQGVPGSSFNLQPQLVASRLTDIPAYEHSSSRAYHHDIPMQTPMQVPMQVPMSAPMQSHPSQVAPQMIPAHEKPDPERYVYDSQGNPYYDLKYKMYLTQPPPATRSEETPRAYATEPPASAPAPGYWAVDPASGKQYYVINGRSQWAP